MRVSLIGIWMSVIRWHLNECNSSASDWVSLIGIWMGVILPRSVCILVYVFFVCVLRLRRVYLFLVCILRILCLCILEEYIHLRVFCWFDAAQEAKPGTYAVSLPCLCQHLARRPTIHSIDFSSLLFPFLPCLSQCKRQRHKRWLTPRMQTHDSLNYFFPRLFSFPLVWRGARGEGARSCQALARNLW